MSFNNTGLVSRETLRTLTRRSNTKGLCQLLGHLALILVTGGLIVLAEATPALPVALWLHGIVLAFLFAPLHETIHITAFRARWLNNLVANVCGFALLLPPRFFRAYHLAHHRHTQDPEHDPELPGAPTETWSGYLWHVSGLPLWYERISTMTRHAVGRVSEPYIDARAHRKIIVEARVFLAGYGLILGASILLGIDWAIWFWGVPLLLGQPVLRLYLLAEHTGCREVPDMQQNSRTTHTNAFVRFLAWNMPYHAEHHASAAVPFHALPALHALVRNQVVFQSTGYWQVIRKLAPR